MMIARSASTPSSPSGAVAKACLRAYALKKDAAQARRY
jgi:hypothetical protein